jgi:tRNA U34 5-methylaminomethyl-2-thiouridine-forming methyltransferase MnmC
MDSISVEHVITSDGSSTLFSPRFQEHYHSIHGAVQESMHVFIQAGLQALPEEQTSVDILEMGLGTGLNALLTLLHAGSRQIHYCGVEAYPLTEAQVTALNYPQALGGADAREAFARIHALPWGSPQPLSPNFTLHKVEADFLTFEPEASFDLIFFDAFAPTVQPELWSDEMMARLFPLLKPGGIFTTYSAKSSVRKGLIKAGFRVEKLEGPPGKREMLRAHKES